MIERSYMVLVENNELSISISDNKSGGTWRDLLPPTYFQKPRRTPFLVSLENPAK